VDWKNKLNQFTTLFFGWKRLELQNIPSSPDQFALPGKWFVDFRMPLNHWFPYENWQKPTWRILGPYHQAAAGVRWHFLLGLISAHYSY
jgi:hypothetical protein